MAQLDMELTTARALESAKKLESERLATQIARLEDEKKKAEAAAVARQEFESSEAARAAAMKQEVARLKKEYESLARVDDSAPEFIRQINALEKTLKEIGDRYESIKQAGNKGINAVYVQKAEALKASLVIEPWENDRDFAKRTGGAFTALEAQKEGELSAYALSVEREMQSQAKDLKELLDKVGSQFAAATYVQSGSSIALNVGAFDREAKVWSIELVSTAPDFFFRKSLNYSIISAPDLGAAYRAFDTALQAGALAPEIEYSYTREPGKDFIPAKTKTLRIKDLSTGKTIVAAKDDSIVFYLLSESPGERRLPPILRLRGALEGSNITINGKRLGNITSDYALEPGAYSILVEKDGYEPISISGEGGPGQVIEKQLVQKKIEIVPMVLVSGGTFSMGSSSGESDEKPVHQVTVSSFMMGKYEVTQEQYQKVMGTNPSFFTNGADAPKRPVERVSWYDAVSFCNKLSEMEGLQKVYTMNGTNVQADFSRNGYRLPTEAEWEYAARGGSQSRTYSYSGSNNPDQVAWYDQNSGSTTHQVGTKAANELGLYDMSGNVWEWCWDFYGTYPNGAQTDPVGASSGDSRVFRGGGWYNSAESLRSAFRNRIYPGGSFSFLGFRVLCRP